MMRSIAALIRLVGWTGVLVASLGAQEPRARRAGPISEPAGVVRGQPCPVVIVLKPDHSGAAMESVLARWTDAGWRAVGVGDVADVTQDWFERLRRRTTIAGGRFHLAGEPEHAVPIVEAWPSEFRAVWLGGDATEEDRRRCAAAGVAVVEGEDPTAALLEGLHRYPAGTPERQVDEALDDFHDAAGKGDAWRYFGRFAPEAVFLGNDPEERWDLGAFRAYAMPAFAQRSAPGWIYVPRERHVRVAAGGGFAWFDEVMVNRDFGEVRGSGVLRLEDGKWLLCQYNMSVLVPNDLATGIVAQIRAHAAPGLRQGVTVVALCHAESEDGALTDDGQARVARLRELVGWLPVGSVLASAEAAAQATAGPVAEAHEVEVTSVAGDDLDAWADGVAQVERGVVIVVGTSETVPALLERLGFADAPAFGVRPHSVFVGRVGAELLELRY